MKLYNNKTPKNGLILFCGEVFQENNKNTKKILIDFEPFKPINTTLYSCDSKFDINVLYELL